jgi:replication factor C small subunit
MQTAYEALGEVGVDDRIDEMLDDAESGRFTDARKLLDELLIDEGYTGNDVLEDLLTVARSRYDGRELAEFHRRAGEVDLDLVEGTSDRIQIGHLLADLGAD